MRVGCQGSVLPARAEHEQHDDNIVGGNIPQAKFDTEVNGVALDGHPT